MMRNPQVFSSKDSSARTSSHQLSAKLTPDSTCRACQGLKRNEVKPGDLTEFLRHNYSYITFANIPVCRWPFCQQLFYDLEMAIHDLIDVTVVVPYE
jgi:hypothetical protein